jgi:dienelactone hydrolase
MATPSLTKHTLPGVLGPLLVDVRSAGRDARPAVVVIHGFKGFKDWGMFPVLADRLARAGFTAVTFNLSGSGVDDRGEFRWPERFGHNTFSAELQDIRAVLGALDRGELGVPRPPAVGLVGHSRGGGMAVLAAADHPGIGALVTWAAISHVDRWPGQADAWRAAGKLEVVNQRTGQVLPLYPDVLEDVERNRAGPLDIAAAARRLTVPWLILHGGSDTSVLPDEAEALARAARERSAPTRLRILPEAGHTFGAVHPFAGMTPALAEVLDATVEWLNRYL